MTAEAQIEAWLDVSEDASSLLLRPQGDWVVRNSETVDKRLRGISPHGKRAATFDLSHLRKLDTTGAWLIFSLHVDHVVKDHVKRSTLSLRRQI